MVPHQKSPFVAAILGTTGFQVGAGLTGLSELSCCSGIEVLSYHNEETLWLDIHPCFANLT